MLTCFIFSLLTLIITIFVRPHFTKDHTTVCTGCKAVLRNTRQLANNFYQNGSATGLASPSSASTFNFWTTFMFKTYMYVLAWLQQKTVDTHLLTTGVQLGHTIERCLLSFCHWSLSIQSQFYASSVFLNTFRINQNGKKRYNCF